jgi:phage antirepressor YoqD-like protein
MDEDFVERAFIQKACRRLTGTRISVIQAWLREPELPVRGAFIVEVWARERGEWRAGNEIVGIDTTKSRVLRVDLLHRQLEAEMAAELAELCAEREAMRPKAEYHDRLVDATLTTNFRDTAKELGVQECQFIETLIRKGYIYRDSHGNLKPYHNRMKYFAVKDWERDGKAGTQTRITVASKAPFLSLFERVVADKPLFS